MRTQPSKPTPFSTPLSFLVRTINRLRFASRRHFAIAAGGTLVATALLVPMVAAAEGPLQCTLDGKEKAAAMREIRAFFVSHHAAATVGAFTITLKSKGAATERELQRLIDREQACCSGLKFEVEFAEEQIHVVVSGPIDEVERARRILPAS